MAGTDEQPLDLRWGFNAVAVFGIGDDPSEVGVSSEILNVRFCERMAEESFREEYDESFEKE